MDMLQPFFSKVRHFGYIVRDLDATIDRYSKAFGVGPFRMLEPEYFQKIPYMEKKYRGQDEDFLFRCGLAPFGPIEIEFIQPLKGRTVYDEFLREKGGGLHHIAVDVPNLDRLLTTLADQGIKPAMSAKRPGLSWAYIEVGFLNGTIMELMDWGGNPP